MKKLLLLPALCLLASATAVASYPGETRGVTWGGQIHYMSLDSDQKVVHYTAVPTSGWKGPWDNDSAKKTANLPSGYKRQDPDNQAEGQGIVVFGSTMIHYAVVWSSSSQPRLVATRYDLTAVTSSTIKGDFVDKTAVDIYGVPNTGNKTYGVAAVVFLNKIYVFASNYTLTSDDGVSYKVLSTPLASGLTGYNALDALTFYSPNAMPKVMALFAKDNGTGVIAVVWDGNAALPLPSSSLKSFSTIGASYGALMVGTAGTSSSSDWKFNTGQKRPCVQIFLLMRNGYGYVYRYEYDIEADTISYGGNLMATRDFQRLRAFPWYEPAVDSQGRTVQKQYLVLNFYQCDQPGCLSHSWQCLALTSDVLVPTLKDPASNGYGWQGVPTPTTSGSSADEEAVRRKYWSLVGVALGGPPFAENGKEAFEVADTSFVDYGIEDENTIEHKTSWSTTTMVGSSTEVKEGLSKKVGFKENFDVSYKWGSEGSQTDKTEYSTMASFIMGTKNEAEGNFGIHGWALFSAPMLLAQVQAIYAYDYNPGSSTGTDLGLRLPAVLQGGPPSAGAPAPLSIVQYGFQLEDPGGADDALPGLMTGMPAYPVSTDLEKWHAFDWEANANGRWKVLFGTGGSGGTAISRLVQGSTGSRTFGSSTTSVNTSGTTQAVSVEGGASFSAGTKLLGFQETLKAGYDSEFETETTTETGLSQDVKIEWGMTFKPEACTQADCVKSMSVQPYLLQALTTDAPWIPSGYSLHLPWCMTWWVHDYEYVDGRKGGVASTPSSVGGTVTGVAGEVRGSGARSEYAVDGGHLAWTNADGSVTPIPITADQFRKNLGATVFLGRHALEATPSTGRWTRNGKLWTFRTASGATRDLFTLTLDFEKRLWSFAGTKLTLSEHLRAGQSHLRLGLKVNGLYRFTTDISHDMALVWDLRPTVPDGTSLHLVRLAGAYSTLTGEGRFALRGTLPAVMDGFGDVSIVLNGHQVDIPLLALDGAEDAIRYGGLLVYEREGRHFLVDFGKKTWSATLSGKGFHPSQLPTDGKLRVGIKVGGATWYQQALAIPAFTADLAAEN